MRHSLITRTQLEASRYLPLLEKNLGECNYDFVLGDEVPIYDD